MLANRVPRLKLILIPLLLTPSALTQGKPDPSLAPYRIAAHNAFTEAMVGADQPLCPDSMAQPNVGACLDASLKRAEADLAAYRAALRSSIAIKRKLLGAQSLGHFQSTEQIWERYSQSQLKASGDMAEAPKLIDSAQEETRIHLIRTHLRVLDRIYYTLLHDDCGACLVDH